jgi:DNA-binding NtrC family response regulator
MGGEISRDVVEKSRRLRVLIVDDEPLIRWSLSETLAQTGHAVTEARDARETLQRLAVDPPPDVILLDYRLPDSDDLGLLEAIRRVAPCSPVVMMTAFSTPAVQAGALALGAFRVVSKPFEMGDLSPLVQQAYESRQ